MSDPTKEYRFLAITDGMGWGKGDTRAEAEQVARQMSGNVTYVATYATVPGEKSYVDQMGRIHGCDPDSLEEWTHPEGLK